MKVNKPNPTIFPIGYGLKTTDSGVIIIDFIDSDGDDTTTIISSIALPETKAIELANNILKDIKK